jgi:hypothetical protein
MIKILILFLNNQEKKNLAYHSKKRAMVKILKVRMIKKNFKTNFKKSHATTLQISMKEKNLKNLDKTVSKENNTSPN